jgi:hypothetical protein
MGGSALLAGSSPEFESKHLPKINEWANSAKEWPTHSCPQKVSKTIAPPSYREKGKGQVQNKLRIKARQGKEQERTGQKRGTREAKQSKNSNKNLDFYYFYLYL